MSSEDSPSMNHKPSVVAVQRVVGRLNANEMQVKALVEIIDNACKTEDWTIALHRSYQLTNALVQLESDSSWLADNEDSIPPNPTGQATARLGGGSVAPGCSTPNSGGSNANL
jgi:hypothetical protein